VHRLDKTIDIEIRKLFRVFLGARNEATDRLLQATSVLAKCTPG
jgi:hypothetical protein